MQSNKRLHSKIMNQGRYVFEMLENYDKTREWPLGRRRIDITLDKRTIKKLKEISQKLKKSVSRIIEEAVMHIK